MLLRVAEALDDARRDDRVLHRLIDLVLKVFRVLHVRREHRDRRGELLMRCRNAALVFTFTLPLDSRAILVAGGRDERAFWTLRISSWPFSASSPSLRCFRSLHICTLLWIAEL